MKTEAKLIKTKLGLLQLAEKLGNVSQACKVIGYSEIVLPYKSCMIREGEIALYEISRKSHYQRIVWKNILKMLL